VVSSLRPLHEIFIYLVRLRGIILSFNKIQIVCIMNLGGPEIILIVIIVLLMFGGKKLPELMRGFGRGMKEFKEAKDGVSEDPESKPAPTPIAKES